MADSQELEHIKNLIKSGFFRSHNIDSLTLSSQVQLISLRRTNQMLRLCVFLEAYRRKHQSVFEPLLERKSLYHAMNSLFGVSIIEAQQYELKDIVILFHSTITEHQYPSFAKETIDKLNDEIINLSNNCKNNWKCVSEEHRYISDYFWEEFPIEEAHRILGKLI
ncbi:hypothetical protein [Providencia rettgeri]|uniref:hypothetical protein n=1 Tax=Providencia rettgeri TaxID=587 RepID=UPI001BA8B6DA|nr:hypothetical protein [Providencia rettgeri]MBS0872949.1 hypothetical protein [Providencia rettgeri]MBS0920757.1 hypothetical protein [Providencia rettgeri]